MTDDPKITKVSPRILEDLNAYGRAYPFDGIEVVDAPDLPDELTDRGIEVDDDDAALLRDETQWPPEARAAAVAIVKAAEAYGVRFEVEFRHDGVPLEVTQLVLTLTGP